MLTDRKDMNGSGAIIREIAVDYASGSYASNYMYDLPQQIRVYGAGGANGGALTAETNYSYDSTSVSGYSGFKNVAVSGLTTHDDTQTLRGNGTQISQMTGSQLLTTQTIFYNILGEVIQANDAKGNATYYDYTDNFASNASCVPAASFAYPTAIRNALAQNTVNRYNACDGSMASTQDQNDLSSGRAGTVYSFDSMQRPTVVAYPDGGQTTTNYGGSSVPEVITTTKAASPSPSQISAVQLDVLGRTGSETLANGPKC